MPISVLDCLLDVTAGADDGLALARPMDHAETFRAWWGHAARRPPDLFGIAAALALCSTAYADPDIAMASVLEHEAAQWHAGEVPARLVRAGDRLWELRDRSCNLLDQADRRLIMELIAMSDCAWGMSRRPTLVENDQLRLATRGSLSRLDPARIRVLPKFRTPQVGLTIRSWTHHLAAVASEVPVQYHFASLGDDTGREIRDRNKIRILVCPWPFEISDSDFTVAGDEHGDFAYFEFEPKRSLSIPERWEILDLVDRASELQPIDLLVLPECALTDDDFGWIRDAVQTRNCALLAGVRGHRRNQVRYADPYLRQITQTKHHRWKVDENQIERYELGNRLTPHKSWWENIEVTEKTLMVVDTGEFSLVPLVCEDLARQEPIAPIVRALGPSLVIALLLDGPQLPSRWSAHYATVLAEDPGSSVLTLTGLGMVLRSKPPAGHPPSRSVGLWRSPDKSFPTCLDLPDGARGLVLTIANRFHRDKSADGRMSSEKAGILYLAHKASVFPSARRRT